MLVQAGCDLEAPKTTAVAAPRWPLCLLFLRAMQVVAFGLTLGSLFFVVASMLEPATLPTTTPRPRHKVTALWQDGEFECIGFRATSQCSPNGARVPSLDLPCNASIVRGMTGYCEVRNRTSGVLSNVMEIACDSIDDPAVFRCDDAKAFSEYPIQSARYVHPEPLVFGKQKRGIVFSIYEDAIPGVYAIIQLLRSPDYNCTLPVELFYEPHVMDPTKHLLLQALLVDGSVALRTIDDRAFSHFRTKPYAVYHASFEQVLLLDCDNIPLRDPTYLFESLNATTTTAIFWPDFWQPSYSIFNVHAQSLLWQYLDMPFIGGFEQESGQVLIDRRASARALHKLMFYTTGPSSSNASLVFLHSKRLLYGDKDLFRFAWLNTSTPYHFILEPPAFAGVYRWWLTKFCGLSIIQFDMSGRMTFLHRNMAKLNGDPRQVPVLRDIARFNTTTYNASEHYMVECKGRQLGGKLCWGFKWPFVPYDVTPMGDDHRIRRVEAQVLRFAVDAGTLGRLHHLYDNDPPSGWYQLDLVLGLGTLSVVASFAYRWVGCRRPRKPPVSS